MTIKTLRHSFTENTSDYFFVPGLESPIFVKRNKKAKRIILRVNEAQRKIVLTLPSQFSLPRAKRFAQEHTEWISEKLDALKPIIPLQNNQLIPVRGELYKLIFSNIMRCETIVCIAPKPTELTHETDEPLALTVNGPAEHASRRLKDWLKKEARRDIDRSVQYHAERLALRPKRISVRDQKTRWGSCSSTGVLSFSWRLVLAPHYVLDYVAAHEVAHLAEMNHSHRFWDLVRKTMPDMDRAEDWLKQHGSQLHRYS